MNRMIAILGVCGLASASLAQGPAVVDFTGGGVFDIYYGGSSGDVVGFRFTADVDMTVTALGVRSDGFIDSEHMLGIWSDSDLSLLTSVTVDNTGDPIGDFVYESIPPIELTAGERYTIGAMYVTLDNDSYISNPDTITLDGISDTIAVYPLAGSLGFVYPDLESPGNEARLGPNFLWEAPGGDCPADLDGDDDADADDFFAYLDAFAAGNLDVCDIDEDGDCDADDFFGYLDLFAQGC